MINGFRDVFAIERNASGMRLNSIQNVNNKHAEKQIAIRMAMANGSLNSTIKLVGFFFQTNTLAKCLHKAPMKFKINEFAVRKAQTFDLQYTYSLVCVHQPEWKITASNNVAAVAQKKAYYSAHIHHAHIYFIFHTMDSKSRVFQPNENLSNFR